MENLSGSVYCVDMMNARKSRLPETTLTTAAQFYLRQDSRLRKAGLQPLAEQPGWAEVAVWAYACEAAERMAQMTMADRRARRTR